ncbi:MAG: hypothetical protein DLM50_07735 [Candidatus Meridianibacter frigidus]|nr:MAG: hypothetical protein DLM50_07735 [Candidatus Eremiobacteraeota bacterium]
MRTSPLARNLALLLALGGAISAITIARPPGTPGPLLRDFEAYYAAGVLATRGMSPYTLRIWDVEKMIPGVRAARNEALPFVGPPTYLPMWRALASFAYRPAAILWTGVLVIAFFGTLIIFLRKQGALSWMNVAACVLLCVGFGPLTSGLALGQDALLSLSGLWLAVLWYESSTAWASVALLAAALQPNAAVTFLSQLPHRRAFAAVAAAMSIFLLTGLIFEGHLFRDYFHVLIEHGRAERFALIQITPGAVAAGFGVAAPGAVAISVMFALGALVASVLAVRTTFGPLVKLGIVCALLPLAIPFFHEHNFVLLLPSILVGIFAPFRPGFWFGISAGVCAVDWLGLAQRPEALPQSALLLATFALALYCASGRRYAAIGACTIVPVMLLVAHLAQMQPAPVWPDAMHGGQPLSGSISAVWHDELLRTGQFEPQPLWAALRACSLLGSGLLCACLWRAARTYWMSTFIMSSNGDTSLGRKS